MLLVKNTNNGSVFKEGVLQKDTFLVIPLHSRSQAPVGVLYQWVFLNKSLFGW